ncbi:hypothetical protein [Bradyrhizobium guangdongense]|uniref:Uncharacterized protein n=1 Tax=Bradyrhizobium guangdongense TaxID=1325090 RepID=A0A410V6S2_9BRAD|nr:hypothetical protein [Bradyrhizobium guangdongense]QAU39411.1 hypothetical protein X265_18400 [Bradyrhizobium guangdongense]QOZ60471.1 hypothetical protein XH86_18405 [Bradyrhizobium guangdongense]GGI32241.1 hypothetical protein GCM10010987_68460 [Bradyrhizobium guangdongense]
MRRRVKHTKSFRERLLDEAARYREAAERLEPGTERELLMRRVYQAEKAAQISDWLAKPNAPPPRSAVF